MNTVGEKIMFMGRRNSAQELRQTKKKKVYIYICIYHLMTECSECIAHINYIGHVGDILDILDILYIQEKYPL